MSDAYRVAVVTGATSGIGKAIVPMLRARGLTVYAVGRNETQLAELEEKTGAVPVQADVRDTARIAQALEDVEVDVLVNNAGILSTRAAFQEIDPAEIDAMIDVNLKAPLHLTRVVAEHGGAQARPPHLYRLQRRSGSLSEHGCLRCLEGRAQPVL